ncbi:hypothetical protein ALC56_03098 [Trachymyrmex septentrionalis]|uniref:Gustatory receptor n=1 Tax=Trachymyrmex septentrionalis TaxID=34720 RepID=A0A151JZL7_9HYME|nr:hypothetical protein ALC56_03098 [Trachymyrmex septentrionalis]
MTETLESALAPLLTIGSFCNLYMIEYPRGQPRAYLSYLYALAKWGSLTYFYYYPIYVWHLQTNESVIFDFFALATITLILISLSRFKELKTCLRELAIVDDSLEALGATKEYQRLRNWIIRIIVGWIVLIFYILACTYAGMIFIMHSDVTFWNIMLNAFVYNYSRNVFILHALISAVILGLVLHICIHLFCNLFLLTLCV